MIKAAVDAEETRDMFDAVFSDISRKANETSANLAKNYGLARTESKLLLADTADMLTGFGFGQDAALGMSAEVQKLAVDLAKFKNLQGGATRASQALTKALLGERESAKLLGIAILEEDVKARVTQLVQVDRMTFASKRQARAFATLQLAQEQSKNAIGAWSRESKPFPVEMTTLRANIANQKKT